jgi:protein O-GlcNAc transferase|tara:strand:- start:474 stop:719 length:246 start_codon:yes stop_codon:yes gene_type:complete
LLAGYNDVDIALDPYPYSGGLKTYEAIWMGAPVVTMPRNTFASRHLTSHLMALGAPEFIATDESTYVQLAVNLASDPDALA